MRARRAVSSVRQVSAWLIVAAGLALYGALVSVLGMARISPNLPLPWWAVQAVPPILYAMVIRVCVRRVSILRWIAATLCLWGVHVFLGVLTDALVSDRGYLAIDFATVDAFIPPALPAILWVPLLLLPFRDVIGGRPPASSRRPAAQRQATPAPVQQRAGAAMTRPGTRPQPTPGRAPSPGHPINDRLGSRETGSGPRPSPAHQAPAGKGAPASAAPGAGLVGAAASPLPHRLQEAPADNEPAVPMRISFDRVADQLPPGACRVPLDRIGVSLQESGHLLIPQRLVLAQLAEGFVRAGWEVVAEQFPRDLLSMSDEEMVRHLPDGQLVLPLDELVPQLPAELFAPTGRTIDIEAIASVPAPFQPVLAEWDGNGRTGGGDSDAPPMAVAPASTESPAPKIESSFADEERTDSRPPEVTAPEDVELAPVLMGAAEVQSASMPAIETRRLPRRESHGDFEVGPRPVREGGMPGMATPEALSPPIRALPELDGNATSARVAAALAPLRPFAVGVESADGTTLFTVSATGLGTGSVLAAVRPLLPLIAEGRAPWPVNQLTMRGADVTLILTPLGPLGHGGSVLLCAVPPGGALASLERLSLRAVAEDGRGAEGVPGIGRGEAEEWQEPDLLDSEPSTRVHQIAGTLDALGPVAAHVLRDAETESDLYLFLPAGSDVRMTGRFAGELDRAARRMVESGHTFHTAALRCGRRRLIIRLAPAATGRAAIVVAGGETDRPGLADRQVEGAAVALGAR
jgi:hypothetical protein